MKIQLILVGKTTDKHIAALCDDYSSRLRHYIPFETTVIPELRNTRALSEQQQKQAEGEQILRQLQAADHLVLLDEHGTQMRSVELARWMERKQNTLARRLVLVVGGPYGFAPEVYARANEQLSLSPLTFSHQMIRLILIEQLYRAQTIIRGEPYHHE